MDIFGLFEFNPKIDSFADDKNLYDIEENQLWDPDLETVSKIIIVMYCKRPTVIKLGHYFFKNKVILDQLELAVSNFHKTIIKFTKYSVISSFSVFIRYIHNNK